VNKSPAQPASSTTPQKGLPQSPVSKPAPLPLSPEQLRQVGGGLLPNNNW